MKKPSFTMCSVLSIGTFYLLITGVLCLFQNKMIYQPVGEDVGDWNFVNASDWVEEIEFESEDGTRLSGWYGRSAESRGTVLYFHGNAENVATQKHDFINFCQNLHMNLFVVDYRGFGKSEGIPSEAGLLMDGRAAMRKLNELSETSPDEVVVFGRSLGGGVATKVATEVGARALVLHCTYAALDDLASNKFWYLPARPLLTNRFRSVEWIGSFHEPLFIAHGTNDALIPFDHAERLYAGCPSRDKTLVRQENVGHFDCANQEFYSRLGRFLASLKSPKSQAADDPDDLQFSIQ